MKKSIIEENLKQTEIGYNLIAKKFSETRKHFWRSLEFIKEYVQDRDNILDFGCGNGRLIELFKNKNINYTGVDPSAELIQLAQENHKNNANSFIKINSTKVSLPFNDKNFNSIYSIATFHHLPGKRHRADVAKELYRVAKEDAWIIITVWDIWNNKKQRKNIFKNWIAKIIGQSKLDWNDCQITFTDNEGKIFNRYHHAFTQKELEKVFYQAGFNIIKNKRIGGNLVLVGRK